VLDSSNPPFFKWYPDGQINICYNALDRHVEAGDGDNIGMIFDSVYTHQQEKYTYRQMQEIVGRIASVLKRKFNIQQGDRVLLYLPMIPMSAFCMLACARLGAIHSVVFGGFAAKELASRIQDCNPKLIITASYGLEPNKVIPYRPVVDEAVGLCTHVQNPHLSIPRLYIQRGAEFGFDDKDFDPQAYFDFNQLFEQEKEIAPCTFVEATAPLYVLYTSGTTGQPKGVVRDTGGTVVALNYTLKHVFDISKGEIYFSCSDIGWVVGHSFIVYGPLIRGATTVFFEGKPIVPNPGVLWRIVEQYKVKSIYMAPTAVRIIKKEDYEGEWVKKYDLSSLKSYHLVGERCDPDTVWWIHGHFPNVVINDTWWQTETGWPICSNLLSADFKTVFPTLPGSVTRPLPGYEVKIFDEEHHEVKEPNALGMVVIKLPMPPSFMPTLWGNDEVFVKRYLADAPGYYTTGDAGLIDEKGYLHIMTRVDDVINTCGHRLSTGQMEEVINEHACVVESAVVGHIDEIRGECPLAFVILKGNFEDYSDDDKKKLTKEINEKVRHDIGPIARLEGVLFVPKLPKTRSGKILRGTIKKISNQEEYKVPATIDDVTGLEVLEAIAKAWLAAKAK